MKLSQANEAVQYTLDRARQLGATAADVSIYYTHGYSVTVRLDEVDVLEHFSDKDVSVTVYFGNCTGAASCSDLSHNMIDAVVEKACAIAKYTSDDPCADLPDKEHLAFTCLDLDLYHPWDLSVDQAIELAKSCEHIAMQDKAITNSDGVTVSTRNSIRVLGNSLGFIGENQGSRHSIGCSLIAEESGAMQRDYAYTTSRVPTLLLGHEEVARNAAARTLKRCGAKKIATRKAPVIFEARIARGFIGHFVRAIAGTSLYRKASFLLDHLGKPIFPDFMSIHESPHLKQAIASTPFDAEGVATQNRMIVEDGVLASYLLGSYSARKLGFTTTGNAGGSVHNLQVAHSQYDLPQLIKKMDTGLFVTELMGQGINLVTGNYSRGAAGFWVENGEIQHAVEEITIASNLRDMFKNIIAISNDVDRRGAIHTGSILIDEVSISGT